MNSSLSYLCPKIKARKRIALFLVALFVAVPLLIGAQMTTATRYSFDDEMLTVGTAAIALTPAKVDPTGIRAESVFITVEDASIRYWASGNTPTTSQGHLVPSGSSLELHGHSNLTKFKAIRATGSDAKIAVSYLR